MAKKSVINRERRREKTVSRFAAKRKELKSRSRDLDLSPEERFEALQVLLGPVDLEAVLRHRVAVLDEGFVAAAYPFEHLRLGAAVPDRVAQHAAAQVVTFGDALALLRWQEQPAAELRQVRFDEQRLALAHAAAGEFAEGAVDEALDLGNGTLVLARPQTQANAVAGEGLEHFVRRDEDFATVVDAGESEARCGATQDAFGPLLLRFHLVFEATQLREGVTVEHPACSAACSKWPAMLAQLPPSVSADRSERMAHRPAGPRVDAIVVDTLSPPCE